MNTKDRKQAERKRGTIPMSGFRLGIESKAQLRTILDTLNLSTETSAVQFAIRYLFERLEEVAPRSAKTGEVQKRYRVNLAKLKKSGPYGRRRRSRHS